MESELIEQKKQNLRDFIQQDLHFFDLLTDFHKVLDDIQQQTDALAKRFKCFKRRLITALISIWACLITSIVILFQKHLYNKNNFRALVALGLVALMFSLLYFTILLSHMISFDKFPPYRKVFDTRLWKLCCLQYTEPVSKQLPIHYLDRQSCLFFLYNHKKDLGPLPKKEFKQVGDLTDWLENRAAGRVGSKEVILGQYSNFYHNKLSNLELEDFLKTC